MKYNYFVLIILFLSSCSLFNDYSWIGIEEVTTIEEALEYTKENISYKKELVDYWQFPEETFNRKTGDCEDMASFLAHLFIFNVGLDDVSIIGCVRKSDYEPHMVVKVGDIYYEATYAREYPFYHNEFYTIKEMSYYSYIDIARLYHI